MSHQRMQPGTRTRYPQPDYRREQAAAAAIAESEDGEPDLGHSDWQIERLGRPLFSGPPPTVSRTLVIGSPRVSKNRMKTVQFFREALAVAGRLS